MTDVVIFSSPSYMPRTKVCIQSVKDHLPSATIHLVELPNDSPGYIEGMAKDRLIKTRELIQQGSKEVIILGADCVFYDTPTQFLHIGGDVVLTPHVIKPPTANGRQLYQTGHVNADLILFRKYSLPILDWLISQEMKNETQYGLFYEQTWLSALPFFDNYVGICKDVATNYAYFNFHERELTKKKDRYYVNGTKLNMVQFTGYIPGHPEKISKHYGGNVADNPLILELFQDYERKICG